MNLNPINQLSLYGHNFDFNNFIELYKFQKMPNGCICCAAKDDLINTLDALLEKKSDIDYILVETNGLADSS